MKIWRGVAREASDRAELQADRAEDAARRAAEHVGVDTASAMTGGPGSPLIRHSPFHVGFFGALGAVTAVFLGRQLLGISSILVLLVIAMFLAVGLNPLVELLMRRGVRRGLAVLLVIVGVLGLLALFITAVAPVVSSQIASITRNAPGWLDDLQQNQTVIRFEERYDVLDRAKEYVEGGEVGSRVFGGVLGVGMAVLSALANTLIILVLTIYFLVSLPGIKHAAYRLAPASRRPRVAELGDRIIRSIGAYVAGAFAVALLAGTSTLVFTFLVGLGDYSFALAFIVGLLSLIPVIGSVISGIIITLLGLTVSPTVALITLIYFVIYQQVESYLIYPRIMKRSVDVPGSVTVVAALIGAGLMGIVGALLAVPVAAALLLLHNEVFLRRQDSR